MLITTRSSIFFLWKIKIITLFTVERQKVDIETDLCNVKEEQCTFFTKPRTRTTLLQKRRSRQQGPRKLRGVRISHIYDDCFRIQIFVVSSLSKTSPVRVITTFSCMYLYQAS
ncbi:unnamed protein product [Amoebophrya sp. A25]|nr:unnamed protein product [Amoebophrya sp. A25]|eukprot:GSA25T00014742001.1